MVRVARERISALFVLAEREAVGGHGELAERYVALARKVGTRYNVRVLPEYRELYCRGCSSFWIEGRTVRTRLRRGRRVRTCLRCGRERRTRLRGVDARPRASRNGAAMGALRDDAVLVSAAPIPEPTNGGDEEEAEEN